MRTDKLTDMTKLTFAFNNFGKWPKNSVLVYGVLLVVQDKSSLSTYSLQTFGL
jgi:hypothetical protein